MFLPVTQKNTNHKHISLTAVFSICQENGKSLIELLNWLCENKKVPYVLSLYSHESAVHYKKCNCIVTSGRLLRNKENKDWRKEKNKKKRMARKIHLRLSFPPDNKKWHIPEENKSTGGMFLNIPSVENGKIIICQYALQLFHYVPYFPNCLVCIFYDVLNLPKYVA